MLLEEIKSISADVVQNKIDMLFRKDCNISNLPLNLSKLFLIFLCIIFFSYHFFFITLEQNIL